MHFWGEAVGVEEEKGQTKRTNPNAFYAFNQTLLSL